MATTLPKHKPERTVDDFVEGDPDDETSDEDSLPTSEEEQNDFEDERATSSGAAGEEAAEEYDLQDESSEEHDSEQDDDQLPRREGTAASDSDEEPSATDAQATAGAKHDSTLAGAFAAILAHPGPANKRNSAPILLGSKSVVKRQREEQAHTAEQKAAKKLRLEMKQRGHTGVPKKGDNPEHDIQEKVLSKITTRGVVQLFNAVSKAQKKQKEALASGAKPKDVKISKASFFAELRGRANQMQAKKQIPIGPQKIDEMQEGTAKRPQGWDVLKDDFAGLQGTKASKMKDWDKREIEESLSDEALSGSDSEGLGEW